MPHTSADTAFRGRIRRLILLIALLAAPVSVFLFLQDSRATVSWYSFREKRLTAWQEEKIKAKLGLTRSQYEARHGQTVFSIPTDKELVIIDDRAKLDYALSVGLVFLLYVAGFVFGPAIVLFYLIGYGLPAAARFVRG